MKYITRYIAQSVLLATSIVLAILIAVESFIDFLGELSDLGAVHYDVLHALFYVVLQMPANIYQFFPMASLLGGLIGLGWLASSNELTVIRASGYSILRITGAVVAAALAMMFIITVVGETLAPKLVYAAENIKAQSMEKLTGLKSLRGVWLYHDNAFIHIDHILSETEQQGIIAYEFAPQSTVLDRIVTADKGLAQERYWDLENVDQLEFKKEAVEKTHLSHLNLNMVFNPHLLQIGQIDPSQESIVALYQNIKYRKRAGLNASELEFSFWERAFRPVTTLVMICLGIPFIFGSLRDVSMGSRVLTGIMLGFGFYSMNQFFGPFSLVYQVQPLLAALLPTLLFAMIGSLLLLKVR